MTRPVVSPNARRDLLEISAYIARDNPQAAARWVRVMERKFEFLAGFPESGTSCDEIMPGARYHAVGNYVVYYRRRGQTAEILRVVHGARDTSHLFDN